jgi:hypothetical protein
LGGEADAPMLADVEAHAMEFVLVGPELAQGSEACHWSAQGSGVLS